MFDNSATKKGMCRKMLDIKLLKEKPEYVKQRLLTRNSDYSAEIDRILEADVQRRSLITDTEQLRAKQNSVSKEIPKPEKRKERYFRNF